MFWTKKTKEEKEKKKKKENWPEEIIRATEGKDWENDNKALILESPWQKGLPELFCSQTSR